MLSGKGVVVVYSLLYLFILSLLLLLTGGAGKGFSHAKTETGRTVYLNVEAEGILFLNGTGE